MSHAVLIVAVTALVTIAVRFLPFAVFGKRPLPRVVVYLGRVLPPAIMAALVVSLPEERRSHGVPLQPCRDHRRGGDGACAYLEAQHAF